MATLTSKIQALLTYANGITSKSDTTLGDAVKSLADGFVGKKQWMLDASEEYDIPLENLQIAYSLDPLIERSFNEQGRWIFNNDSYFITDVYLTDKSVIDIEFKINGQRNSNTGIFGMRNSAYDSSINVSEDYTTIYVDFQSAKNNRLTAEKEIGKVYKIHMDETYISINSNIKNCVDVTAFTTPQPIEIFRQSRLSSNITNASFSKVHIKNDSNGKNHLYIPIVTTGEVTMIDIINMSYPIKEGDFGS